MQIGQFLIYFLGLTFGSVTLNPVMAGSENLFPAKISPQYQQECAACHLAYPPALLPRQSWIRLMNNLEHHFGSDASIDIEAVKEVSVWLNDNAGTYKRVRAQPKDDRITESDWFVRKHRKLKRRFGCVMRSRAARTARPVTRRLSVEIMTTIMS